MLRAAQSLLSLTFIHCCHSGCGEFGQCFPPKEFVTEKVAYEEKKPETSQKFITLKHSEDSQMLPGEKEPVLRL